MPTIRERASTPVDLASRLADLRTRRGLTQTDVASQLDISRWYVSEIEAGKPSLFSERPFRLLALLDVELIIEGEDVA